MTDLKSKRIHRLIVPVAIAFLLGAACTLGVVKLFESNPSTHTAGNRTDLAETSSELLDLLSAQTTSLARLVEASGRIVDVDGFSGLEKLYESIGDSVFRDAIIQDSVRGFAQKHSCESILKLGTPSSSNSMVVENVLVGVCFLRAHLEPIPTLNAVRRLVDSPILRSKLQNAVATSWAERSPSDLQLHLDKFDGISRVVATRYALIGTARRNPDQAMETFHELRYSGMETEVGREIALSLVRKSTDTALYWAQSTIFSSDQVKQEVLSVIFREMTYQNVQLAFDKALEIPLEHPGQIGMEAIVIATVATLDPSKAAALLPDVRPGVTALKSSVAVGNALLHVGEHEKALQLGSDLSEQGAEYVGSILEIWALLDPISLFGQLDSVSPKYRSLASLHLLLADATISVLPEDVIQQLRDSLSLEDSAMLSDLSASRAGRRVIVTDPMRKGASLVGQEIDRKLLESLLSE